jgi:type I restriction enzyme, S subunit
MTWKIKTLGDVCEKGSSNVSFSKIKEEDGKYPIYGAKGFIKNISFYHQDKDYISIIKDGAGIGRINFREKYSSVIGTLQYLIPTPEINIKYLYYFLLGIDFLKYGQGAAIPHIYYKDYSKENILVPPLLVQKEIVSILDKAFEKISKARENAERNLKNSKEVFESYLQSVFENKGDGWEEKTLGKIAKVIGGYPFKSSNFRKQGKYQVIRMGNVRHGFIRPNKNPVFIEDLEDSVLKKALLLKNDVIITQTGTKKKRDYGFTTIIKEKNYLLNQRIAAIRFSKEYLSKFFLYYSWTNLFRDQYFSNETGTVGQGNVGIGAIKNANIPFLSMKKQEIIVSNIDRVIDKTKKLEQIYTQKLENLKELNQSILQKAFKGELTESLDE